MIPTGRERVGFWTAVAGLLTVFAIDSRSAGAEPFDKRLAEIPSLYMNARFGEALSLATSLESQRAGDPLPVLLRVHALLWQYEYEGEPPDRSESILSAIDETVRRSSARLRERPDDADAEFCWGLALLQRSRLALDSGSLVTAGSLANAGNAHLQRAQALRPTVDFRFALGLYQYFGAQIPKSLGLLRWLWFVPSGDREVGLAHLQAAASNGSVFGADAQTVLLSISYEEEGDASPKPLEHARRLANQFPADRLFEFAQLQALFGLRRYREAGVKAERLMALPLEQNGDRLYRSLSRIWLARVQLELGETSDAEQTIAAAPAADRQLPRVDAWHVVVLAQIDDVRGNRSAALARYRQVLDRPQQERSRAAALAAQTGLTAPYRARGE